MKDRPSSPEMVCLQCGDVGFKNAFVYCVKCLKFVVHRYCLNVMPKSTHEFVRWICDDCEAEKQNQHHLLKNDAIRERTRDRTTSEHILGNSGTETRTKKTGIEHPAPQSYDPCAKIKSVECSESDGGRQTVALVMKDEAIICSAADEGKGCELSTSQLREEENVNHSLDRPYKECTDIGFNERAKLASDSTVAKDVKGIKPLLTRDRGLHHAPDAETTAALPPLSLNSGSLGSSKKIKPNMPSAAILKDHVTLSAQHLNKQKGFDLGTPHADMTTERSNLSRESKVTIDRNHVSNDISNSCNGSSKASTILPSAMSAEPIMDSIWRGSFNIHNNEDDILEDIMAHMSRSACQKVQDEACQFKPVLDLEMLPRAHVWPQSFEKSELVVGNIALYFFPSERSERFYDDLVGDMVDEDLALKAIVKNAELLVFPSTKLPLSYWRFQGKYYLWGVFRTKRPPKSGAPSCGQGSTYNPVKRRDSDYSATMKNFGGQSPLSPLSHCSSYGSHTL